MMATHSPSLQYWPSRFNAPYIVSPAEKSAPSKGVYCIDIPHSKGATASGFKSSRITDTKSAGETMYSASSVSLNRDCFKVDIRLNVPGTLIPEFFWLGQWLYCTSHVGHALQLLYSHLKAISSAHFVVYRGEHTWYPHAFPSYPTQYQDQLPLSIHIHTHVPG